MFMPVGFRWRIIRRLFFTINLIFFAVYLKVAFEIAPYLVKVMP